MTETITPTGPARLALGGDGKSASFVLDMPEATGLVREETADALSVLLQYDASSEAPVWMRGRWPLWIDNSPPQVDQSANFDQGYTPPFRAPKVEHGLMGGQDLLTLFEQDGLGPITRARITEMLRVGQVEEVIAFLKFVIEPFHKPFCDFFDRKDIKLIVTFDLNDGYGPFTQIEFNQDAEHPQVEHMLLAIKIDETKGNKLLSISANAEYRPRT